MCERLASAGFDLVATDVRAQAGAVGCRRVQSVAEAAAGAVVLITMLPGPDEVLGVLAEAVDALAPGSLWVEMSSASPRVAQACRAAAGPRGIRTVDAPVSGGPEQAGTGNLAVYAGGEAADVAAAQPLLEILGSRLMHTGGCGSGYATKLLINALWFTQAIAAAEALSVGSRLGLDLEVLVESLRTSPAGSRFLSEHAEALLDGDDLTTFPLARCCEELHEVIALADSVGVPVDVIGAVSQLHDEALERYGSVDGELLGSRLVAERAGVSLRREPGAGKEASPRP
jgi:3-hydroxyisobutyrate dehydrogenase-like beta-hydroxyacid dehydrogenase